MSTQREWPLLVISMLWALCLFVSSGIATAQGTTSQKAALLAALVPLVPGDWVGREEQPVPVAVPAAFGELVQSQRAVAEALFWELYWDEVDAWANRNPSIRPNSPVVLAYLVAALGDSERREVYRKWAVQIRTRALSEYVTETSPNLSSRARAIDAYIGAVVLYHAGRRAEAALIDAANLNEARRLGMDIGVANLLGNLAVGEIQAGRVATALPRIQEAISLAEAYGHKSLMGGAYRILGMAFQQEGRASEAATAYRKSHVLYRDAGHRIGPSTRRSTWRQTSAIAESLRMYMQRSPTCWTTKVVGPRLPPSLRSRPTSIKRPGMRGKTCTHASGWAWR